MSLPAFTALKRIGTPEDTILQDPWPFDDLPQTVNLSTSSIQRLNRSREPGIVQLDGRVSALLPRVASRVRIVGGRDTRDRSVMDIDVGTEKRADQLRLLAGLAIGIEVEWHAKHRSLDPNEPRVGSLRRIHAIQRPLEPGMPAGVAYGQITEVRRNNSDKGTPYGMHLDIGLRSNNLLEVEWEAGYGPKLDQAGILRYGSLISIGVTAIRDPGRSNHAYEWCGIETPYTIAVCEDDPQIPQS